MNLVRRVGSSAFALLCGASIFAVAAAAAQRFPDTSSTTVGGLRLLSERDDDAVLTGLQIFISGGLGRQTRFTNGAAAVTAECVMRTPVHSPDSSNAAPLRDAIAARGGSVSYSLDERTVHYYVESRPERMPEMLALLGSALAAPDFDSAAVATARKALTSRVIEAEKNPFQVGVQMFRESFLQSAAAYPEFGTAASLAALSTAQVREFYAQTYRRGGVTVSVTGRITPEITTAIGALGSKLPEGTVPPLWTATHPLPTTTKRIIAQRDVGRPFVIVGFGAPSPNDRDFGPMLILETLLSDAFERSSATTLSLGERSVGAVYFYDSAPASLVVYVNGGTGIDPSVALREIVLVAKSLAARPLGPDALKRFKAAAQGQFVTNATTLSDRAYLIGMLSEGGLGNRTVNGALDAIGRATSADVQRAAKTYLQRYIVALVVPRQAQQE